MKALFIHAHFDDYEVTAAGTFELWRRKLPDVSSGVISILVIGDDLYAAAYGHAAPIGVSRAPSSFSLATVSPVATSVSRDVNRSQGPTR